MSVLIWFAIGFALLMSAVSLILAIVLIRIVSRQSIDRKSEELGGQLKQFISNAGLPADLPQTKEPDSLPDYQFIPLSAEIIRLADQGLDNIEIARRLEIGVGEVELVANLYRCSGAGRETIAADCKETD